MKHGLTIVYTTSRVEPRIEWFFDSLANQSGVNYEGINIVVVDSFAHSREAYVAHLVRERMAGIAKGQWLPVDSEYFKRLKWVAPKPTVWQGEHRLTKEDWWAKSNALNTGICLCETEWIAFCDDRSVLEYRWLDRVNAAMEGGYAVCGYYEKRANMRVKNGVIVDPGELLGADTRTLGNYPFDTLYGGHCALPLEWCLAVNGYPELCDGLGLEDSLFGTTLRNSGYPLRYDSDLRLIEDRTPGQIDGSLRRADYGTSPNDASHKLVEMLRDKTTSQNPFDIRNMRDRVLNGEPFPPPTGSPVHFFTGTQIASLV